MNDDLLKKLLQGIQPQDELSPQIGNSPAYEVMPNLDPAGPYPSPMAYPERTLDFTNEPPDVIQGSVPKPTIKPPLPFMPKQELPVQQETQAPVEKKASLADLLANLPKPGADNELMNKQTNANDTIRNILMARAANKIGASIAGVNADEKYGQDFVDLANKDVTDLQARRKSEIEQEDQGFKRKNQVLSEKKAVFELGDKEKENDPNSELSKSFREFKNKYYESMGSTVRVKDGLSFADLSKTTGALDQSIMTAYLAKERSQDRAFQRELSSADKANKSSESKAKFANTIAEQMKDVVKVKENSNALKKALESAQKNPSGFRDISVIYKFVKALDSDSAVKEGEVDLLRAAIPAFENIKNQVEGQFKGDISKLSPKARAAMLQIANEYVAAADSAYDRKLSTKKAIAEDLGIPQKYYDQFYSEKSQASAPKSDATVTSKFPMTVKKGNQQATVSNEQELKEATSEGWQ